MGPRAITTNADHALLRDRWTDEIDRFVGDDPGRSALVTGDGLTVAAAADVVRPGASILKVFVAIAAHLLADEGEVDLDATLAVHDLPTSRYPSVFDSLSPDHRFTLAELVRLSLATSDNRVGHHLVEAFGTDAVNEVARSLGCRGTQLAVGFDDGVLNALGRANVTTAADCALALIAIAERPELAPLQPALRSWLFGSRILSQLPEGTLVSHKTGSLKGVANDVGTIHGSSGDLVVCFLTDGQPDPTQTSMEIGRCAAALFDAWEGRPR